MPSQDAAAFNKFLKTLFSPEQTLKLPFFLFLSDVFHLWYKDSCHLRGSGANVCVCVGQQEDTEEEASLAAGLWGFSWLSEHLKGRLLFGGSSKWCEPEPLVCAAGLAAGRTLCLSAAGRKPSM